MSITHYRHYIVHRQEVEKHLLTPEFTAKCQQNDYFRVFLRKRPLTTLPELKLKEEGTAEALSDVTTSLSKHSILLHEGKLARNS